MRKATRNLHSIVAEKHDRGYLGDNGGLLATGKLGQLAELEGNLNQGAESLLSLVLVLGRVRLVLLNIQTDSGALRSSARQANDQAGSILKDNTDTLSEAIVDIYTLTVSSRLPAPCGRTYRSTTCVCDCAI